ncbi:MAG: EAL domain-containing protein [Terracidiphilus sp.]
MTIRSFKQRILISLASTLIVAVFGTLAGWVFGRFVTLKLAERRLWQDASLASAEADIRLAESQAVLAAMLSSSNLPCSSAELTYFRALIFDAKFLKDAGRMSDGKIECSASLARPPQPLDHPKQDFTLVEGTKVYKDLVFYQSEDQILITLQHGDFYIVLIPYIQAHPGLWHEHYAEAVRDALSGQVSWLLGEPPQVSAANFTRNGLARLGNSLYFTRCSPGFSNCITAYASIPEALQADHTQFRLYLALGGLVGAFLGLFCSVVYQRNRSIEQQLLRAIRHDELRMVYQPIVNLPSGKIVGAEALARWTDEEGFAVGPDIFIKIAEERGFVGEITRLVVRHALNDFGELLRSHPDFHLSINVAAADLADPGFLAMLESELIRTGVRAESLSIEITESSTARHDVAIATILRLHQKGHSVHIDDFGTGYSSLSYLHDLSVNAIKIDKSFTQAIGTEAVTLSILPQIMAMAKALHLQVIVEGIETSQQAGYFSSESNQILGQGWLFGRPVAPEAFARLLEEQEKAAPVEAKADCAAAGETL